MDEFNSPLFGSVIVEFIGACAKWLYYAARASAAGLPRPQFKDIFQENRTIRRAEKLYGRMSNGVAGLIVVGLIILVVVRISTKFGL